MTVSFTNRAAAALHLALLLILLPVNVLWHGLPVLWEDYPTAARRLSKTLWTGKRGPYPGVVW